MIYAANWKMHGSRAMADTLEKGASESLPLMRQEDEIMLFVPSLYVNELAARSANSQLSIGAQNCHHETAGAYTGEISAQMIADAGASWVLLGHSERRAQAGESNSLIAQKAATAHQAGLNLMVCIGEDAAQNEAGLTKEVLSAQLEAVLPELKKAKRAVIAYEPIWSIGTGKLATLEAIADIHHFIKEVASGLPVLYGGSVKPENAGDICGLEPVDGVLVGGASLKAADFRAICTARPS